MEGSLIRTLLEKDPFIKQHFAGIYSSDALPDSLGTDNRFIIINTSLASGGRKTATSAEVGHWTVLFSHKHISEYFDPLGSKAADLAWLLSPAIKISRGYEGTQILTTPVQSDSSTSCGHFVVYFAYGRLRLLDYSFKHVIKELFTSKTSANESRVLRFTSHL
jgi:hypothetical protein